MLLTIETPVFPNRGFIFGVKRLSINIVCFSLTRGTKSIYAEAEKYNDRCKLLGDDFLEEADVIRSRLGQEIAEELFE